MHNTAFYARAPLGQAAPITASTASTASSIVASPGFTFWRVASMGASAALAYHGYKRNNSIGWALAWALLGGIVWPAGLAIAFAQGFGKSRSVHKNRRRSRRNRR